MVTEASHYGSLPKGSSVFTVGRKLQFPDESVETYTITEEIDLEIWAVDIIGENPRDGRYNSGEGGVSKVSWSYSEDGVSECIASRHMSYDCESDALMALLKKGIVIYYSKDEETPPYWAIGSPDHGDTVQVQAGVFMDCIRNCTMVYGSNILDVVERGSVPDFQDRDFGCFRTETYYARGVGMVKEVQYNTNGDKTYELELVSFSLSNPAVSN